MARLAAAVAASTASRGWRSWTPVRCTMRWSAASRPRASRRSVPPTARCGSSASGARRCGRGTEPRRPRPGPRAPRESLPAHGPAMTPTPTDTATLFSPLTLRSLTLRNRIVVSPMCQYSSEDGFAADWHLVHLGRSRRGGAGAVVVRGHRGDARGPHLARATWGSGSDAHVEPLARIARFVASQGAAPGIQLAHAGRKASTDRAVERRRAARAAGAGGWTVVGPAATCRGPTATRRRRRSTSAGIAGVIEAFRAAARRAREAGFEIVEMHARARLPAAPVPLAARQHAHRPLGRRVREPRAPRARGDARRAARVAGEPARVGAHLGDRLGRGRLGRRPDRGAGASCCAKPAST